MPYDEIDKVSLSLACVGKVFDKKAEILDIIYLCLFQIKALMAAII